MQATHEQQMAALGQHYQRALQDLTTYLGAQIPRAHQAELPPLLFAPPPILVPTPFSIPVSILPIALAYVAILHVLMRSLALCAGTVGGFELDSTCQPSTRPFSTARVPAYPTHPTRSYPWPTQTYQLQRWYSCPPPPPQQGYSYPPPPPQQGHSGPASTPPANYRQTDWSPWEQGWGLWGSWG